MEPKISSKHYSLDERRQLMDILSKNDGKIAKARRQLIEMKKSNPNLRLISVRAYRELEKKYVRTSVANSSLRVRLESAHFPKF